VEIVKMDNEELHVPGKASTARYQILPKKSKLGYVIGKNWKNLRENENQRQ
jgi:hypothetical protein